MTTKRKPIKCEGRCPSRHRRQSVDPKAAGWVYFEAQGWQCPECAKVTKRVNRGTDMRYLSRLPAEIPEGWILVHNRIRPPTRIGWRGFRAWLARPATDGHYQPCGCRWREADSLGHPHYAVRGWETPIGGAVTASAALRLPSGGPLCARLRPRSVREHRPEPDPASRGSSTHG